MTALLHRCTDDFCTIVPKSYKAGAHCSSKMLVCRGKPYPCNSLAHVPIAAMAAGVSTSLQQHQPRQTLYLWFEMLKSADISLMADFGEAWPSVTAWFGDDMPTRPVLLQAGATRSTSKACLRVFQGGCNISDSGVYAAHVAGSAGHGCFEQGSQ